MQVWVGWQDGGAYSDKWTAVEGAYASREAGQRAARAIMERQLARHRKEQAESADIASGKTPYEPRPGYYPSPKPEWRRMHGRNAPWYQGRIDAYLRALAEPWQEVDPEQSDAPAGAVTVEVAQDEWRFTVAPFEVQD